MKRETLNRPTGVLPPPVQIPRWGRPTRIAFRFAVVYLGLFCLATQIAGSLLVIPDTGFRGFGLFAPFREVTTWLAAHLFNVTEPFVFDRNSGETTFFWVQTFWIFTLSVAVAGVWSFLDRRRENYVTLHKWFRLFIRFALAASMFEYGMTKVIPIQFPQPPLNTLITPVGNLTISGLLWASIGASPAYEMFTGCVEMLGGILLLIPRTTMLGAMISMAAMAHVFVLNLTYDIGLKQISFHLILLSVFLLAPDIPRFVNFLFRDRPTAPSAHVPLFETKSANRIALVAQLVCGIYLIGMQAYANWNYWYAAGGGSPRSPLYGIWNIEQMSVDGNTAPPILNDYDRRWRRVIFDAPNTVSFQRLDDSFARFGVSIDVYKKMLMLTKGNSRHWKSSFSFQQAAPDHLTLDGEMEGRKIHMELQLADFDTFRLLNSRFGLVRPDEP